MARKKERIDGLEPKMPNLFDMIEDISAEKIVKPDFKCSSKPMPQRVREIISEALKNMDRKRWEVAGQMSELCGSEITESMLNAWTAESKEGHRFPLEFVPAFCEVTGDYQLIEMAAYACGCMVAKSEEIYLLELGRVKQAQRNLSRKESELRQGYETMKGVKK